MVIGTRGGGGGKEPVTEQLTPLNSRYTLTNSTVYWSIDCKNAVDRVCEICILYTYQSGGASLGCAVFYPAQTDDGGYEILYPTGSATHHSGADNILITGSQIQFNVAGPMISSPGVVIAGAITYLPA